MLVLAPLIGVHLTPLLVLEIIGLELLMAVALTSFGVFVASRIEKMEGFQVVMQLLLFPMIFLSGALFPLNGLPGWLTVLTRINPLTYAVAPLRQVVFAAQNMPAAARARFPASVELFGHTLSIGSRDRDHGGLRRHLHRARHPRILANAVNPARERNPARSARSAVAIVAGPVVGNNHLLLSPAAGAAGAPPPTACGFHAQRGR